MQKCRSILTSFTLSACVLVTLITFAAGPVLAKVVDKTLAIVNGDPIMTSEFDKTIEPAIDQYKQYTPPADQTPAKLKEFKQKLLDQMVDDKILKQEATKRKIRVSAKELEDGVKEIKKRFKTEGEFQDELRKSELTQSQFDKRIQDQLAVMKMIQQEIQGSVARPTDEAVQKLYKQIQDKMAGKDLGLGKKDEEEIGKLADYFKKIASEHVRARHILVAVDKNASMTQKSEASKKIKKIQAELAKGADFKDEAAKYSDDTVSAKRGGDLGYFTKDDMVAEFSKVAFTAKVGEISEPFQTEFGWHILKVEEKRAASNIVFEDVSNDLKDYLYKKTQQVRYDEWMKGLRAKATIKINSIE
jgi:parvulin-like peptidyl-prolyl isomerase